MDCSKNGLFSNIAELDNLLSAGKGNLQTCSRDTVVIARGSVPYDVHVVVDGAVKESITTHSGKEILFSHLSNGAALALCCSLARIPVKADFIASRNSVVWSAGRDLFLEAISSNLDILISVFREIERANSNAYEKLHRIRAMGVAERTRAELLRYITSNHAGEKSEFRILQNLPTHEEIANSIFSHREAVTKEISRLKKMGVISRCGGNSYVANVKQLVSLIPENG